MLSCFYENDKFPLIKKILNKPQTKLNFSSSNPNNFYILITNTITDKCTLVRDLCKLFQQGSLHLLKVSSPNHEYHVGI